MVRTWWMDVNWLVWGPGGGDSNHSCRATSRPPASLYFLASMPVSCLSKGIAQLIMTRKIIAAHMMKTLDPRPKGDLHPTWVLYFLCGLRKVWKETDLCGLDSDWAVVTTQSVPYGRDGKGWAAWGGSICEGLSHQIGTGLQQISHAKYPSKLKHVYFFF